MARNTVLVLAIVVLIITMIGQFTERAGAQTGDSGQISAVLENQREILQELDEVKRKLDVIRVRIR